MAQELSLTGKPFDPPIILCVIFLLHCAINESWRAVVVHNMLLLYAVVRRCTIAVFIYT
jgi:hypothetical protein